MKGLVLAAGKGSRLYPVTHIIAKPLLPLANKPTLAYAFERLKEIDVYEIGLVVGDNEQSMREVLKDGSDFGVSLTYIRQPEPKGLAHAVSFAKDFIGDSNFVLYLGDAIYGSGFVELKNQFLDSGCSNLNLVKEVQDPSRFGVANVNGDKIVKLVEKPKVPESNLAMAGLYFFRSEIWNVLPKLQPSSRGEFEITDAIQLLIDEGNLVLAGRYEDEWFDTGTLDSFLETSSFLVNGSQVIGSDVVVEGHVGDHVVIGDGAFVRCNSISDSVILPGARVVSNGDIIHSIIGGSVESDRTIEAAILHGDWSA
ncbi:MAG: NTP transferase domain-containing protein [Fimbriimonadaceae bacterium]|jgi:glucose-1-phosphate thymidylyltransferase|nr:NTP transferase domain-containing protein [Fimbriimonadaceae bacterium]